MNSISFANFQVGQVDDPSNETAGGFEFASGMDIFSEPGVIKASPALAEVGYGTSANPNDVPRWMVDVVTGGNIRSYISAGAKILESTDGSTYSLFLTNGNGVNNGLGIWNSYVVYVNGVNIGRTLVGNSAGKNDSYLSTLDSASVNPIVQQGGTLKIGAGRYVASLDESFTLTPQAMKLPAAFQINCLAEHFQNLFIGTYGGSIIDAESSVFAWGGIPLASGSALPSTPFPMKQRGMNALLSTGRTLLGFPDRFGQVLEYDGSGFAEYRQLFPVLKANGNLAVNPASVVQTTDNSILFSGDMTSIPGVYQMKNGAICQAYVPAQATPGVDSVINVGFIKVSHNGIVFIGYYKSSDSTYHIERTTSNRQNGAVLRTLWHKIGFGRTMKQRGAGDKFKRWGGVKLNLKPLPASTSVAVAYRTNRSDSFTDSGYTITSANQEKPVIFTSQPRSREIQYRFTFTTSTSNTPELLSYDPLFDVLNVSR